MLVKVEEKHTGLSNKYFLRRANLFSKKKNNIKKNTKIKGFFCLGDVTMRYGILLHKRDKKYLKLYTDVSVAFLLMLLSF